MSEDISNGEERGAQMHLDPLKWRAQAEQGYPTPMSSNRE